MLSRVFHRWERRLAAAATDRVVRPFEWGLDWVGPNELDKTFGPEVKFTGVPAGMKPNRPPSARLHSTCTPWKP